MRKLDTVSDDNGSQLSSSSSPASGIHGFWRSGFGGKPDRRDVFGCILSK